MKYTVWYSCTICGATKEPVLVRGRREKEDVKHYVGRTIMNAVGQAHRTKHPDCPGKKVDLMLPIPEDAEYIGDPNANYEGHQIPPDTRGFKPI